MTHDFNPLMPRRNLHSLADFFAAQSPSPSPPPTSLFGIPLSALGRSLPHSSSPLNMLLSYQPETDLPSARRRVAWNERFEHWEKPATVSEAGRIERAESLVSQVIAGNRWLNDQGVTVAGQGSYFNNTNVRTEADIDLRVVHPSLRVIYNENVYVPYARDILYYGDAPLTFDQIFTGLRVTLGTDLRRRFGDANVSVGNKAIRIKGVTGSRAEVDVVPALRYHHVTWIGPYDGYQTIEGVAILGTDGLWTVNFPVQHHINGIAKRARTAHRFKRVVRVFKRLCADMTDRGLLSAKIPSFLVECLVYAVEDRYFLVEGDDRYGRVRRVARRIQELLIDRSIAANLLEINEIKPLFHSDQGWTYAGALTFANAVVAHLGDA